MIAAPRTADVMITDTIKDRPELSAIVDSATARLQDAFGEYRPEVEIEWSLEPDDEGVELIVLRLRDWTGTVETRFTSKDLKSDFPLHFGIHRLWIHRLWSQLLQQRSSIYLQRLRESLHSLETE